MRDMKQLITMLLLIFGKIAQIGYYYSNWLSGFHGHNGGSTGVAYHHDNCGCITPVVDSYGNNWVVSSDMSGSYRANGVTRGSTSCTYPLPSLAINKWNENSDFMIVDVILFSTQLPLSTIQAIENALMAKYGVCAPGQYIGIDNTCTLCPVGYYCVSVTKLACPQGYSTSSTGSTSSSQCSVCAVGYYMSGSSCVACATGYSTMSTGCTSSSQCSICATGYYITGSTCTICSSGYSTVSVGSTSSSQCSKCATGYYMTTDSVCNICFNGMNVTFAGSIALSQCGKITLITVTTIFITNTTITIR